MRPRERSGEPEGWPIPNGPRKSSNHHLSSTSKQRRGPARSSLGAPSFHSQRLHSCVLDTPEIRQILSSSESSQVICLSHLQTHYYSLVLFSLKKRWQSITEDNCKTPSSHCFSFELHSGLTFRPRRDGFCFIISTKQT